MDKMNGKEIIVYARSIAPSLGKKERYVVKFISNNYAQLPTLSIGELARQLDVSEAAVTKACKKLRCKGYYELKHIMEAYLKNSSSIGKDQDEAENFAVGDRPERILEKVFMNSQIAIQDTQAGMDYASFAKATWLLGHAARIALVGIGGSGILCQDFRHKLLKIGIVAISFQDVNMQFMTSSILQKGDVILGISHSGTTKTVIDVLRLAKAQEAKTICITNHAMSPITEVSDLVLCSSAQNSPLTGENASARIAQLNILDALYTTLALKYNKTSYSILQKTKDSVRSNKV